MVINLLLPSKLFKQAQMLQRPLLMMLVGCSLYCVLLRVLELIFGLTWVLLMVHWELYNLFVPPDLPIAVTVLFDKYSGPTWHWTNYTSTLFMVNVWQSLLSSTTAIETSLDSDYPQGTRPHITQTLC